MIQEAISQNSWLIMASSGEVAVMRAGIRTVLEGAVAQLPVLNPAFGQLS